MNLFFHSSKFTNLQSSLINVESIERFKVNADIISILIHNNTLQSFVWSSIALNIPDSGAHSGPGGGGLGPPEPGKSIDFRGFQTPTDAEPTLKRIKFQPPPPWICPCSMFPIRKLIIFFCGYYTKVTHAFQMLQKQWRNEDFSKVHWTCHSKNGGSIEIVHVFQV